MQELATMGYMDAEDFKKETMRMLDVACPEAFDVDVEDNSIEMEDDADEEEADDPKDDDESFKPEENDCQRCIGSRRRKRRCRVN